MTPKKSTIGTYAVTFGLLLNAMTAQAFEHNFKQLALKDYEDMQILVQKELGMNILNDSEREPKVRAALELVLSRRNTDGKRGALFRSLQAQLPENFFALSLKRIAQKAVDIVNSNSESNMSKATALVVIENLLAEVRPQANVFEDALNEIASANIKINDNLRSFRRLEGMDTNESPSQMAKSILKEKETSNMDKALAKSDLPDLVD